MGKWAELYCDAGIRTVLQLMVLITAEDTTDFQLELSFAGLTEHSQTEVTETVKIKLSLRSVKSLTKPSWKYKIYFTL